MKRTLIVDFGMLLIASIFFYSACTNKAATSAPQPQTVVQGQPQQAPTQQQPTTQAQAVQPQPQAQKLTATGTAQEWQVIINVLNQSTAPHTDVVAVTNFLVNQLNPQVKQPDKK